MIPFFAVRQISVINLAARCPEFLRLFRHSDCKCFFFFNILLFRKFADILGDVLGIVDAKVSDIETKIRELTSFKSMLLDKVKECRNECPETENCTVFDAEMNL